MGRKYFSRCTKEKRINSEMVTKKKEEEKAKFEKRRELVLQRQKDIEIANMEKQKKLKKMIINMNRE